jgi:[ribosomal protein S18]-alanine N-acetyltransferase
MRPEDVVAVVEIESASFPRPWTTRHFLDEIDSSCGYPMVATTPDGTIAGFLCLKQVLDEGEILDVAVRESMRGRGVGRMLVDAALAQCRERGGAVVSLEVRVGNDDAIALYQRVGFREIGRRKRYYENGDDAIVMEYIFSEKAEESDAV